MIRIFIGYDPRETVAWHVLTHSILARSSEPVSFVPFALNIHCKAPSFRSRAFSRRT